MPNLYQINSEIERLLDEIFSAVDPETGEIVGMEAALENLDHLQIQREEKIENIICFIKNQNADAAALKAEEEALSKRRKQAEKKAEGLKNYLTYCLHGEKFSSPRGAVSFRQSEIVEVKEELLPKKWMKKTVTFKPDKIAIKDFLKQGKKIKGCELIKKINPQIK